LRFQPKTLGAGRGVTLAELAAPRCKLAFHLSALDGRSSFVDSGYNVISMPPGKLKDTAE